MEGGGVAAGGGRTAVRGRGGLLRTKTAGNTFRASCTGNMGQWRSALPSAPCMKTGHAASGEAVKAVGGPFAFNTKAQGQSR